MAASEARIQANRQNALLSTGPKTPEGKAASRRNSFKHGLTGEGIVLPNEDVAEVEHRIESLRDELGAEGEVGEMLARRAAVLSVRIDRCVSHETASLAGRIRQADAEFVAPEGTDAAIVAQLRAEAKARAMFDPSKEATLARKYEAAAERGFYRALKELRDLRRQAEAPAPAPPRSAAIDGLRDVMASFDRGDEEFDAFEAEVTADDLRAARAEMRRQLAGDGRDVDVPITIGRRR